jgi:hypothetical protein
MGQVTALDTAPVTVAHMAQVTDRVTVVLTAPAMAQAIVSNEPFKLI